MSGLSTHVHVRVHEHVDLIIYQKGIRTVFRVGSHGYAFVGISVVGDTGADKRVVMRFLKLTTSVHMCLQDIQPLRYFNFGGDETPEGAWEGSPACDQYTADNGETR